MSIEIIKVEIVPYNTDWPLQFKKYSEELSTVLIGIARRIDHIGSTAVPGLSAKPIIDIQVSVDNVADEELYTSPLEKIGYDFKLREPDHVLFILHPNDKRLVNLHICKSGSEWEQSDLMLRDFLRTSPEIVQDYSRVKIELAKKYPHIQDYYEAKNSYMINLKKKASEWERTLNKH